METCPTCQGRGVLPEPKTCRKCGVAFLIQETDRRKTDGLAGARLSTGVLYCSRKCAKAAASAEYRRRQREAS